jgi:hypothetical protein
MSIGNAAASLLSKLHIVSHGHLVNLDHLVIPILSLELMRGRF